MQKNHISTAGFNTGQQYKTTAVDFTCRRLNVANDVRLGDLQVQQLFDRQQRLSGRLAGEQVVTQVQRTNWYQHPPWWLVETYFFCKAGAF